MQAMMEALACPLSHKLQETDARELQQRSAAVFRNLAKLLQLHSKVRELVGNFYSAH